ncbi:MAG: DUF367 family protein [Nitrosopumilaceae archaeon]|nr:DUF367 family protein [Nitrosopumilaceae archaeon]NIU01615.1 DUF367 family protein [Nitrosopumilaceae archaeon]NIU88034.1 DUF367 family protein [Nitrosopumilaceae archaeon]NIV66301.1 DUF367 family protein [Nitrosopumilaceae archaeon]NIX62217.1 DUF367 family protein [Nitrosopumilaceae archaeon]
MYVQVFMLNQDDPKKCTAAKLVKFGLARRTRRLSEKTILLDPYSDNFLMPQDKFKSNSITAIDCSWNRAEDTFTRKMTGIPRKIPPLFAGNPVNYSKLGKLTSAEALAGALCILGNKSMASEILQKFKWGHTFYELNKNLLEDYSKLTVESEIGNLLKEYRIA